jgi:hypothetical protein
MKYIYASTLTHFPYNDDCTIPSTCYASNDVSIIPRGSDLCVEPLYKCEGQVVR